MKQSQALAVMARGDSVFLTGPAGSGKTYVLNKFIRHAKRQGKQVAITASTGIAATHLNGTTIHSWSGLGIRDFLSDQDKAWLKGNDRLKKRYNSTDVLIIDEVSMLHGARLDMVDEACKLLRENGDPFGGLQVILTGDLFQLPPVNRGGGDDDFVHRSRAWRQLNPSICYITEQHRQGNDLLLDILTAMRQDNLSEDHQQALLARVGIKPDDDVVLTRLFSHNVDVESINQQHLNQLAGDTHIFEMSTDGRAQYIEQLVKSVLAPEVLELKVGAEVMFVANNFAEGYANGTRGQVVAFNGDTPIVRLLASGKEIAVEPHNWTREEDGRERGRVTQLPLRLAWAITIHKSQGMSLDAALVDLSRSFTYGMGYVALSRVRSIDGLYLHGINGNALLLHPDIYEFDRVIQAQSLQLADEIGEVADVTEVKSVKGNDEAGDIDTDLFDRLRAWRLATARAKGVSPFIVAHNTLLEHIAKRKPLTEQQLFAVPGMGQKKLEAYGADILAIVKGSA